MLSEEEGGGRREVEERRGEEGHDDKIGEDIGPWKKWEGEGLEMEATIIAHICHICL